MAKTVNPLFSLSAAGKLGGLIYQTGRYGSYVKAHVPQRFKPSALQLQHNYAFGVTADNWRVLSDQQKVELNERAGPMKMTGFNLYIKENFHSNLP